MRCVLAVDGGNSKTLALVATLDGTILSVERGACGDIYNAIPTETAPNPTAAALENVELTVTTALRSAHVAREDIAASVFNMAGADWPEDIAFWRDTMTERGMGEQVIAQNDARGWRLYRLRHRGGDRSALRRRTHLAQQLLAGRVAWEHASGPENATGGLPR
jgi:N-acetylglucosamine kinase-like BadF-type ATPase